MMINRGKTKNSKEKCEIIAKIGAARVIVSKHKKPKTFSGDTKTAGAYYHLEEKVIVLRSRDDVFNAGIMIHELTHHLQNKIIGTKMMMRFHMRERFSFLGKFVILSDFLNPMEIMAYSTQVVAILIQPLWPFMLRKYLMNKNFRPSLKEMFAYRNDEKMLVVATIFLLFCNLYFGQ
jgi:hypothetical protein